MSSNSILLSDMFGGDRSSHGRRLFAQAKKPNILVIMGDDVGWFNIGAYHRGMMSGKTPNRDTLAAGGMMFTDYYAEASCTAGRANFITGELPIRTGLTTVGQAGADVGMPDQAATIASALKVQGYETYQFGKNHLGDLNKYLPCLHGFDEFFGYLYHLDAMSDPYWFDYPQDWIDKTGPRDLTHCWATDSNDSTVMPRWGPQTFQGLSYRRRSGNPWWNIPLGSSALIAITEPPGIGPSFFALTFSAPIRKSHSAMSRFRPMYRPR
jgi:Sulfatase